MLRAAWIRLASLAPTVILIISLATNIMLTRRVNALTRQIERTRAAGQLLPGTFVDSFELKSVDGRPVNISLAGQPRPTVVYVFTPQCSWCARNLPTLKEMSVAIRGDYRVIGLSLSERDLQAYVAKVQLPFPVYTGMSADMKGRLKLGGTPQTFVVSRDGRVIKNWLGAYSSVVREELQAFFKVRLTAPILTS